MLTGKAKIGTFFTGLLCIASGIGICILSEGDPFFLVLGIMFLFFGCCAWYAVFREIVDSIEYNNRKKEEAKKHAILNQEVKEGKWLFPAETFYLKCQENHVANLDNEFSLSKATQIAVQIIQQSDSHIDLENCGEYLKKERLEEYLKQGEHLANETERNKIQAQKEPRNVKPNDEEKTFLERARELQSLTGCGKRVKMLSNLISDYDKKIKAMREGEEALKKLGVIYAQQQQKESDWAIMGGIASEIAGPAAGIMVASSTMENNRKIQEHNAAMRKASMNIMSGIPSLAGSRYQLEEERSKVYSLLHEAKNKVVLSKPGYDEIRQNILLGKATVKKNDSGVLAVTIPVSLKKPFVLDVPENVSMVVDGVIRADVFFEDQLLDHVYIPFPLYGIPCNMTAEVTLDGMCGRSVEYDGEYTVKISEKHNLWVMEA